jgi:hypothetical protein
VSLEEQELLTFPEHLSSTPVFSGVRVTRGYPKGPTSDAVGRLITGAIHGKQGSFGSTVEHLRRVYRYQRGNQIPYIEEEQTTQWPKQKRQTTIYKIYTKN